MKNQFFRISIALLALLPATLSAHDLNGTWQGRLKFMKFDIRIVFRFAKSDDGKWSATVQSPEQSKEKFNADDVFVQDDSIAIEISDMDASYNGRYIPDSNAIVGKMTQRGYKLPLKLMYGEEDDLLYNRPQRPRPPFPYYSEEVRIVNAVDHDTLAGTFTRPARKGKFPAVVLVTGSGAQDRDESVFGHKPFLLLSDYLTRNGYAVLRCDDRGTGASTGEFATATTGNFATDAEAQLNYLRKRKDVDKRHIGVLGHSEGGIIAPMLAAKDKQIAFIILLAGPSIDMFDLLLAQDSLVMKADGGKRKAIDSYIQKNSRLFELLKQSKDSLDAQRLIVEYLDSIKAPDREIELTINQLCSPWMRWYVGFQPGRQLEQLHCAVLALNGEKDIQVPAVVNIPVIDSLLKHNGNRNYKTVVLPGLNHLFQPCTRCDVAEYKDIDVTMDPAVLLMIKEWLDETVR